MTPVLWMTMAAVGSWLAVAVVSPSLIAETFLGMCGPLLAVIGTWLLVERTARANPAGVTAVMTAAFAAKMVFFGLYVALVLLAAPVDRIPFAFSFAAYFVGLYAIEAYLLHRLFGRLT